MRRLSVFFIAVVFIFSASVFAHADTLSFVFASASFSGSATITGTADPFFAGAIDVTSVTGNINGVAILLAPAPAGANSQNFVIDNSGLFRVDNVIYPRGNAGNAGGDGIVDFHGLLFEDANLVLYNIYSHSDGSYSIFTGNPGGGYSTVDTFVLSANQGPGNGTFSLSQIPEPSSLVLLGTGFVSAVGLFRRRMKAA